MSEQSLNNRIEIRVGGLAPPLHEQLGLPEERCDKWQKISQSIVILKVHGILPQRMVDQCGQRLVNMITIELTEPARIDD